MQTIVFANRKGGVGKSTSAIAVAAALAERGERVVLVDADTNAGVARALGLGEHHPLNAYDVLVGGTPIAAALVEARPNLFVLPADSRLALVNHELPALRDEPWQYRLRDALEAAGEGMAVIDTPPSLDALTVLALVAADAVIIPTQLEAASLRAVYDTLRSVRKIRGEEGRRGLNPRLGVFGVLPTFAEFRSLHSRELLAAARDELAPIPLLAPIPMSVRLREATAAGEPIGSYAPRHPATAAYGALAEAILVRFRGVIDAAS